MVYIIIEPRSATKAKAESFRILSNKKFGSCRTVITVVFSSGCYAYLPPNALTHKRRHIIFKTARNRPPPLADITKWIYLVLIENKLSRCQLLAGSRDVLYEERREVRSLCRRRRSWSTLVTFRAYTFPITFVLFLFLILYRETLKFWETHTPRKALPCSTCFTLSQR